MDAAGEPLTGAATQRRLLALLVALAVAGDRGVSRDKLVALLWPEADEERGRHSLTQALYAARRALGIDDLFLIGGDIRLNRERLSSDVEEMEEALDAGDLARAAGLYQGPFADGFFLPGSGEFEQWSSLQRSRLEDRIAGALDRLARRAEEAGRPREALEWRKRLAAIRPLDTSAAVALMNTLAHAGDRAGALQHARLHETMLREQLGLDPDPVMASLVARLREPRDWKGGAGMAPPAKPPESEPSEAAGPADRPGEKDPLASAELEARRPQLRWSWLGLVLVALIAGPVTLYLRRDSLPSSRVTAAPPLEQKVVVAPFRVAGATTSLAYLREGLVELLSTRLADDSTARSVDAGAVLNAWRVAGLQTPSDAPRDTVVGLARELGAERVVMGSVVGTSSRVVITAAVVDVGTGRATGGASVEGPADSITTLVDRLAGRLLLIGAGEDASLSAQTTRSLYSLRAFLDGQSAFRRGNYLLAARLYERSLEEDSTFALAALQLARSADRLQTVELRTRALALAWRERASLDARARALLVALAGPSFPAPSDAEEQVSAWERLIDLTPDRADAWYELGSRLLEEGPVAGAPDARARAVLAFRRALQLDSTHAPTREMLARVLGVAPEGAERQTIGGVAPGDSALLLAPYLEWRAAVARADTASLERFRDTFPNLGPRNLRAIAVTAQLDGIALNDARRAVQQLRTRSRRVEDRMDALLADHALALNQGRVRDAYAVTERLAEIQPGARTHLRLRALDALYGDGDTTAGAAAARALRRFAEGRVATDPSVRAVQLADLCVLAQWRLSRSDTTGVRRAIGTLRRESLGVLGTAPPVATAPLACADLLEAGMAVAAGRPEAKAAVARLDSLAFTVGATGDGVAYAPIYISRLHRRLGDTASALAALRRRDHASGWPRYLATALREQGYYAAALGQAELAREALGRYLTLRARPDAELRAQAAAVRQELGAISTR